MYKRQVCAAIPVPAAAVFQRFLRRAVHQNGNIRALIAVAVGVGPLNNKHIRLGKIYLLIPQSQLSAPHALSLIHICFVACGSGYFRLSTFGSPADTQEAARRLAQLLKK